MSSLLLSLVCLTSTLTSCEKERVLPENPDVPIIRYATDLRMPSKIVGGTVLHSVFLPADYKANPDKRYPVVYLLHGFGDNYKSWNDAYLNITSLIENLEKNNALEPMIYVMPDGYRTYYVNRYDGSYRYMDMFAEELVPYIDKSYRTLADKDHRAVVGYSMGGFGAFILPSKHRELFSHSVPLSMSFRTDEQYMTEPASGWDSQWGSIFGGQGTTGAARLTDYYKQHCPYYMFSPATAADYASTGYFLDCGDDEEQLLVANDDLHVQMREQGIAHEYRVRNGAHTSSYWRSGMQEVLPWLACRFNGQSYKEEEAVTVPDNYSALREEADLAGVETEVFLPKDYAGLPDAQFPVLLYAHDGSGVLSPEEVMKVMSEVQEQRPFVLIAFDAASAAGVTPAALVAAAESKYRLKAIGRAGLASGDGGKYLYTATTGSEPLLGSLFLVDAALGEAPATPSHAVFYYISLADMGANYRSANTLYKACHKLGVPFEYRVYNGKDDRQSALYGLVALRTTLTTKIGQ